jgi:hypothetical protein
MRGEFVADTENFAIWKKVEESELVVSSGRRGKRNEGKSPKNNTNATRDQGCRLDLALPSFDQAAVRGVNKATRPMARVENFIL